MTMQYAKDQPTGYANHVKNIAIVGASGSVGSPITAELLKTGMHNVTAITRPESKSSFPEGVQIAKVDYGDRAALVNALHGQDVFIITMNVMVPVAKITQLVEAALEAGVPWILPNEWGSDYTDTEINRDTMLGPEKLEIRKLIQSSGPNSAYIAVACGFWYEYSMVGEMLTFGFDFSKKELTLYDDGEHKLRYSTLPYCGQAVAKLLSLLILPQDQNDKSPCLEDYRNEIVRFSAFHLNQKDMLASVLRVTGDNENDWTVKQENSESRFNEAKRRFQEGERMAVRLMLYARMFYPSNSARKLEDYSDQRLGLQQPSLDDATRWAVNEVKKQRT